MAKGQSEAAKYNLFSEIMQCNSILYIIPLVIDIDSVLYEKIKTFT